MINNNFRSEMTGFNNACRIGKLVLNDTRPFELCMKAIDELQRNGIDCQFDMSHDDGGDVSAAEWVSQLRSFCIRYLNIDVQCRALIASFYDNKSELDINFSSNSVDKYKLSSLAPCFEHYKRVVFLGGTNILHDQMDLDKIEYIMNADSSVVIKPHPLTNVSDMKMLSERFGSERVLSNKINGVQLLSQCEHAWVPSSSEMWFTCVMNNIDFDIITRDAVARRGLYYPMINAMNVIHADTGIDKKTIASKIITSPSSGIYTSYHSFKYCHANFIENVRMCGGDI